MGSSNSKTRETCTLACKGQRVVPGPSWTWLSYRAIRPAYVGTVTALHPFHGCEDVGVVVVWDSGVFSTYPPHQTGLGGALRLYDSGPTGVTHPAGTCGVCSRPLVGTRWKCTFCWEFNICHICYMNDKHSLVHAFYRFDVPGAPGVKVPPRKDSVKKHVLGIFPNAKVLRGPHWMYDTEDDAACCEALGRLMPEALTGTVVTVGDSEDGSKRNNAYVKWSSGNTSVCRVGHGGFLDVKCTEPTSSGYFYLDHMPLIAPAEAGQEQPVLGDTTLRSGDQVAIILDVDTLRQLQEGRANWDGRLEQDIYILGTVEDVIVGGDVSVKFGTNLRWPINPRALTKVTVLCPGDEATIVNDLEALKKFQIGHGGYVDAMRNCLGQTGIVLKVFPSQDVRVMVSGAAWTFSRFCLRFVPAPPNTDIS